MKKKIAILAILCISLAIEGYSQKTEILKETNEVYYKFIKSFDSLDYVLFAEIHSERLIRVPGGKKIIDYHTYTEKQKGGFESAKANNSTKSIQLRFKERICNDSVASDRGVYKFIKNENLPNEKISYGNFHVIMVKENGYWKILMDYDSSDGRKITEEDFMQAAEINNLEKFSN